VPIFTRFLLVSDDNGPSQGLLLIVISSGDTDFPDLRSL